MDNHKRNSMRDLTQMVDITLPSFDDETSLYQNQLNEFIPKAIDSIEAFKKKLQSILRSEVLVNNQDAEHLHATLTQIASNFEKAVQAEGITPKKIKEILQTFIKECNAESKAADKIMGHASLYQIVEQFLQRIVLFFQSLVKKVEAIPVKVSGTENKTDSAHHRLDDFNNRPLQLNKKDLSTALNAACDEFTGALTKNIPRK